MNVREINENKTRIKINDFKGIHDFIYTVVHLDAFSFSQLNLDCRKREMYRKKAAQMLREGKRSEARECLQRCIDISPEMALELMNVCILYKNIFEILTHNKGLI